jgi:hypothetical protein
VPNRIENVPFLIQQAAPRGDSARRRTRWIGSHRNFGDLGDGFDFLTSKLIHAQDLDRFDASR